MDEAPKRRKARTYPIAALLALFVVAALVALASRLLPGGLARLARRRQGGSSAGGSRRG
jgi:hypothetical protein